MFYLISRLLPHTIGQSKMKELIYHQRIRDVKERHGDSKLEILSRMDWNGVVEFLYLNNGPHLKFQFLQYLWGLWHNGQISADVILFEFSNERVRANIGCTFLDMLSPEDFIDSDHRIEFSTDDLVPDLQVAFTEHFREFISTVAIEAQSRDYAVKVRAENEHYRIIIQQEIPPEFRSQLRPRETTVVTVAPMIPLLSTQSNRLLPNSRVESQVQRSPIGLESQIQQSPIGHESSSISEPDRRSDFRADDEPHEVATFNFPFSLMSVSSDGWTAEQVVKSVVGDLAPGEIFQNYIEFASIELRSAYNRICELMDYDNTPDHLVLAMRLVQSEIRHRLFLIGDEL